MLHPIGWDAFGLPAEQVGRGGRGEGERNRDPRRRGRRRPSSVPRARPRPPTHTPSPPPPPLQYAIQTGTHPAATTAKNVARFRTQLKALGFSYDWGRELSTADPTYYKWTQWIFLRLLDKGLAYQADVAVNWCPALGTVLANEEVVGGVSERGGHPVVRRPMRQAREREGEGGKGRLARARPRPPQPFFLPSSLL